MPDLSEMSDSAKSGVLAAGGGGVTVTALAMMGGEMPWPVRILISVAVFALFFVGFWLALRYISRRRARKFADALDEDLSRPDSSGTAQEKANLDHLRSQFLKGLEKYKKECGDPYEKPWYLVMGASGSGKSYALRKSGVAWMEDLTNLNQGVGGTRTMDWWFSEKAIFLDTAGRYVDALVGDSGDESDKQVEERLRQLEAFLKLLKDHRSPCPINGLVMVVSAVELQTRSEDQRLADARKLLRTMKRIEIALDVRFPVIVLVTKCDKIAGFRDYFAPISNDPQLLRQMMGWSTPGDLESLAKPFRPDLLDRELDKVAGELRMRRWALLEALLPSAGQTRADVASSLFVFPERFTEIIQPLKKYLAAVFGQSSKPPFFRGIYFTSAVTEGEELDRKRAEALRRNLESFVTEEKEQKRLKRSLYSLDRPFFIKDALTEKLMQEQGLVTRFGDAVAGMRRTQWLIGGVAVAALAVMGLWIWFLADNLAKKVGTQASLWKSMESDLSLVGTNAGSSYFYRGNILNSGFSRTDSYIELGKKAHEDLGVHFLFGPSTGISVVERTTAWRGLTKKALEPIFSYSRNELSKLKKWDSNALMAVKAVIDWESIRSGQPPTLSQQTNILAPLVRFLIALDPSGSGVSDGHESIPKLDTLLMYFLKSGGSVTNLASFGDTYDENSSLKGAISVLIRSNSAPDVLDNIVGPYNKVAEAADQLSRAQNKLLSWTDLKFEGLSVQAATELSVLYRDYLGTYDNLQSSLDILGLISGDTPQKALVQKLQETRRNNLAPLGDVLLSLQPAPGRPDGLLTVPCRLVVEKEIQNRSNALVTATAEINTKLGVLNGRIFGTNETPKFRQVHDALARVILQFAPTNTENLEVQTRAAKLIIEEFDKKYPKDPDSNEDFSIAPVLNDLVERALIHQTNGLLARFKSKADKFLENSSRFPVTGFESQGPALTIQELKKFADEAGKLLLQLGSVDSSSVEDVKSRQRTLTSLLSTNQPVASEVKVSVIMPGDVNEIYLKLLGNRKVPTVNNTAKELSVKSEGNAKQQLSKLIPRPPCVISLDSDRFELFDVLNSGQAEKPLPKFPAITKSPWALVSFFRRPSSKTDTNVFFQHTTTNTVLWINASQDGPFVLKFEPSLRWLNDEARVGP